MKVSYKTYNLPFKYPFTISKGTKTHQPTLIVELEHFGFKGYGEAPAIAYYNIPIEKMVEDLESKKQFVEKFAFSDPERYWHYLHHLFPNNSFLVCALDMAGWDLFGKIKRKQLLSMYNGMDCLIFPSKIETWGLPISEAKIYKKPLFLANLPYAKETCGEYEMVSFFNENSATALAKIITEFVEEKHNFQGNTITYDTSKDLHNWKELFHYILND